jgi:hypothetical protein
MKKKKSVGKNEKRINQTAHQRAMESPEVREALSALRARWSDLSPQQRGEQLNVLIGFKCSINGIAEELGKSATSIRRYVAEAGDDWITTMENAWAEDPEEQSTRGADQYPCHFPSKIPAKKIVGPVINETCPAQDHAHTTTAQKAKKITSPLSTRVKEPPVVNSAMSRQEDQVGEDIPKTSLVNAYMRRGQIIDDKIQRLAAIPEQIKPRPILSPTSMKRQGKPVPPKDTHGPVS